MGGLYSGHACMVPIMQSKRSSYKELTKAPSRSTTELPETKKLRCAITKRTAKTGKK